MPLSTRLEKKPFTSRSTCRPSFFARSLLCAALLSAAASVHANLITNGGFEDGVAPAAGNSKSIGAGNAAITGWTITADERGGNIEWEGQGYSSLTTPSGTHFIDLTGNPDNKGATIAQSFSTVQGSVYRLTFIVGVDNDEFAFSGPVGVAVSLDNTTTNITGIGTTGTGNQWTTETLDFTANGLSTRLSFLGIQGRNYIGLDAVDVSFLRAGDPVDPPAPGAVPEPGALSLFGLGLVAMVTNRRRLRKG